MIMNKITIRNEERGIVARTERAREMAEKAENHPEIIKADNALRDIENRFRRLGDLLKRMRSGPEAERRARKMQAVVVGIRAELRVRLADMVDEAQKRGELSSGGRPKKTFRTSGRFSGTGHCIRSRSG